MVELLVPKKFGVSIDSLPVFNNSEFIYKPLDTVIVGFLNDLSMKILKDKDLRIDPSFAALGYWLRKSNLNKIINENKGLFNISKVKLKPIGIVFHLCPSNVDTMFFYSLAVALLAGNKNVVRISSRLEHPLIDRLFVSINELIDEEYQYFINYLNIVKYGHEEDANEKISLKCDGRIIWGGDETIAQFKAVKTKPKVKDLYFADRVSLSLIKSSEVLNLNDESLAKLSRDIYNDIFTFDQKGCSSPHSLFYLGSADESKQAMEILYEKICEIAETKYDNDINSMASIKFNRLVEDILNDKAVPIFEKNNYLTILELKTEQIPHTCGLGYIYYKSIKNLEDIEQYLNEKVQTIGYFGFAEDELNVLQEISIVDRIVPIGKALGFDYIWDGYNILLEMLSFKYKQ